MPVFKLCMKIIKKSMPSMMIYIVIFLAILTLYASASTNNPQTGFSEAKTKIAFISEESTPLVNGLKQELSKTSVFVNIADNTEKLQDALYFRDVEYIIRIPNGFTDSFMRGEPLPIEKTIVPNSISSEFMDININRYLNTARLYVKYTKNITPQEVTEHVKKDLSKNTAVDLKSIGHTSANNHYASNYFNYLAYILFSVLIMGISSIMQVFNNLDLQRRNFCSPIRAGSINFQFMLANFAFSLACWAIMIVLYFLIDGKNAFYPNTFYYLLNSFVFTLCGSSISYLIGNLIKGRSAISAVCNVVTLGPCFISGVFVPQEFLGTTVLKIASFTPTYWYVKANSQISTLTNFSFSDLFPAYSYILIEFGFAIAFFAMAMVIGKKKRTSN